MTRFAGVGLVVILGVSLLFPRYSLCDQSVSLDIQVVYASSESAFVDPTLVGLKDKLLKLFNYSSFEIISKMRKEVKRGEAAEFSIPGDRKMNVVHVDSTGEAVRLDVKIGGEKSSVVRTALKMERGSIVMVGGPEFKSGVLIILISAD